MGGGAAMRAAAKVAGIGVVNGGLRGVPAVSPSEHPFTAAVRNARRHVSAVVSSSDDVQLNGLVASQDGEVDASVHKPCWEIDEWEFAGGEEELIGESMPRLVFGGVPTLQEAQVATSELKDAVQEAYLSPKPTGCKGSFISGQESGLLLLSNTEYLQTKACVTSETTVTPLVQKPAIQAFKFLSESPGAQRVVASIASDPKVWNAVLQNPELVEFIQSRNTSAPSSERDPNMKEPDGGADFQNPQAPKCFNKSFDSGKSFSEKWLKGSLQNIRLSVVEMMNSLSDYFENLFGSPVVGEVSAEADGSAKTTFVDRAMGLTFMGLAVMVIMVVVLKRG